MSLHSEAEALAEIILELSKKSPKNKKYFIKLPLVFTAIRHQKYGDGKKNLIAIIKCSADYENISFDLKLNEIVNKFNKYGGKPRLGSSDLRKIHNWLQLINFALRAAVMVREDRSGKFTDPKKLVEAVSEKLFNSKETKRSFVAHPEGSKYEFKPLKYADTKTISKWILQEYSEYKAEVLPFGYTPTKREWELYGLRGQTKTAYSSLVNDIQNLVKRARTLDENGDHKQADLIYEKLVSMQQNLEQLTAMLTTE